MPTCWLAAARQAVLFPLLAAIAYFILFPLLPEGKTFWLVEEWIRLVEITAPGKLARRFHRSVDMAPDII